MASGPGSLKKSLAGGSHAIRRISSFEFENEQCSAPTLPEDPRDEAPARAASHRSHAVQHEAREDDEGAPGSVELGRHIAVHQLQVSAVIVLGARELDRDRQLT